MAALGPFDSLPWSALRESDSEACGHLPLPEGLRGHFGSQVLRSRLGDQEPLAPRSRSSPGRGAWGSGRFQSTVMIISRCAASLLRPLRTASTVSTGSHFTIEGWIDGPPIILLRFREPDRVGQRPGLGGVMACHRTEYM
ncbi:hypothetical protein E4U49_007842 [Claviceps purpurea]|nr:hypothetical protein E4U49_007842 [Claviceps purpurea]